MEIEIREMKQTQRFGVWPSGQIFLVMGLIALLIEIGPRRIVCHLKKKSANSPKMFGFAWLIEITNNPISIAKIGMVVSYVPFM